MRQASWLVLVSALVSVTGALALGCSCAGTRPATHHDGGGGGGNDANLSTLDGTVVNPDAFFDLPDSGPPMDTGCDLMTPVPNMIVGDPPDMLILLDISGSMCEPVGLFGGMTKIAIMKTALTNLVTSFDARINFGMMKFPGNNMGDGCADAALTDPIMPMNGSAISSTLAGFPGGMFACASALGGATPTFRAVANAQAYYATIPVNPVGQYVLLATDGLPNCGAVQPDGSTADTTAETVAAIQALHDAGISTYVLGFGSGFSSSPTALNMMAAAGGTGTAFNARDAAELDTALNTIAAGIVRPSCTIMLDGSTRNPALFQVSFDGGPLIPRDTSHSTGWDYDAATNTITFYGSECTTVESGTVVNISVDYGCPGPLI